MIVAKNWELYLILVLPVVYFIIFRYIPMYGAIIAVKDYSITQGIFESEWVGLENFRRFFNHFDFVRIFMNTLTLSLYNLFVGFPFPIVLAIALNGMRSRRFKNSVQMITYAPHFISVVIIAGMIIQFLQVRGGIVNIILQAIRVEPVNSLGGSAWFQTVFVFSEIWQSTGYAAIIYLAALFSISTELHEAAIVDGANKWQRVWHVDIPGILPTVVILLILNVGRLLFVGFEKVLLLQNPLNISRSEIIQTYVYKVGIAATIPDYSYGAAVGLFLAIIGLITIVTVNRIAKAIGKESLW